MIYENITELLNFIRSTCQGNVEFGQRDLAPAQYPAILVKPGKDGSSFRYEQMGSTLVYPLTITVVSDAKDEVRVITKMEKMLLNLNNFQSQKGHQIDEGISQEYTENTFSITINYTMRFRLVKPE